MPAPYSGDHSSLFDANTDYDDDFYDQQEGTPTPTPTLSTHRYPPPHYDQPSTAASSSSSSFSPAFFSAPSTSTLAGAFPSALPKLEHISLKALPALLERQTQHFVQGLAAGTAAMAPAHSASADGAGAGAASFRDSIDERSRRSDEQDTPQLRNAHNHIRPPPPILESLAAGNDEGGLSSVHEQTVTPYLLKLSLVAGTSGLLFGWDTGICAGLLVAIKGDLGHPLSAGEQELVVSATTGEQSRRRYIFEVSGIMANLISTSHLSPCFQSVQSLAL